MVRLSYVTGEDARRDGHNERAEAIALSKSVYEGVLFSQTVDTVRSGQDWVVLVPVTERGDAIGILELSLPERPEADTVDYLVAAAHALAYVLVASRRHTDLFEWAQRDIPFSVAAEIQRRLLPSAYTAEAGSFTLAGWLEPSHAAGGDTFDYSIDREYLYASITDAMGHSTEAALLATLTVGTLRNRRRALATPAEQADAANTELLEEARADQFVTGLILRIRLADGVAEIVNAGHPLAYLLRAGRPVTVDVPAEPPLGVFPVRYETRILQLQPGDRLLLVTDGYLERNASQPDVRPGPRRHRGSSPETDRSGTRSPRPGRNWRQTPRRRNRPLHRLARDAPPSRRQRGRQPRPSHRPLRHHVPTNGLAIEWPSDVRPCYAGAPCDRVMAPQSAGRRRRPGRVNRAAPRTSTGPPSDLTVTRPLRLPPLGTLRPAGRILALLAKWRIHTRRRLNIYPDHMVSPRAAAANSCLRSRQTSPSGLDATTSRTATAPEREASQAGQLA